jgi:hypothetical protein
MNAQNLAKTLVLRGVTRAEHVRGADGGMYGQTLDERSRL